MNDLITQKAVHYDLAPAALFSLLVSEGTASQWMGGRVEIDPVAGGEVRVAIEGWPEVTGHVERIEEPSSLTLTWLADGWPGPLRTVVTILPEGKGTRLVLHETGYGGDDDLYRRRDWLWSHWLVRLAAAGGLASSPPR